MYAMPVSILIFTVLMLIGYGITVSGLAKQSWKKGTIGVSLIAASFCIGLMCI